MGTEHTMDGADKIVRTEDPINPSHYKSASGLQVIDIIEQFGLAESFHLATAITYIFRAGRKPGVSAHQDIEKAVWYLERYNKYHPEEKKT